MARSINKHCSRCLRTKKFWDVGDYYVCELCRKRLYKVQ